LSDHPASPTSFFKRPGVQTTLLILVTLFIAFQMARWEVIRRAKAAYERGEAQFEQKKYREALWNYQEVQEFYYVPKSKWVDQAAEKEWICRAYLGDWVPPEGPLDADVRQTREDYGKYKDLVASVTPVGDTEYQPAPLTTIEQKVQKKGSQSK